MADRTRRDLIEHAALLAFASAAGRADAAYGASSATVRDPGSSARARGSPAEEHSPQDSFAAYVRLRGSLDETLVHERVSGWAYGMVPGEPGRLLWRLDGFSVARFRRLPNGHYAGRYRYLGALRHADDDAVMRVFDNPYSGERCDAPLSQYGPATIYLTPGGIRYREDSPAGPALRPTRLGEWLYFTDHVLLPLEASRQPKFDIVSYGARAVDAYDRRLASVRSTSGFSATERWRPWMKMGERPGALFWHVLGGKVERDELPVDLWRLARSVWGEAIEDL